MESGRVYIMMHSTEGRRSIGAGIYGHWKGETSRSRSRSRSSSSIDAFLLSTGFKDAAFGATAGVAAALASMPCDVIKTRMDLTGAGGGGPAAALQAFFRTGRAIVAAGGGGPQALFVGLVPRLLQTVPSAIVYWCVVEASRRHLGQYVPATKTKTGVDVVATA